MEPKWISAALATAIHDEALHEFGGLGGIRDVGLLLSALDRPRNLIAYEPKSSIFELAASLCVGITKNYAFVDGKNRTVLLSARVLLFLTPPPSAAS